MTVPTHQLLNVLWHTSPEAYLWTIAIGALALTDPTAEPLVQLCPLALLEVSWCPGCGLGRAVSHLFQGEFVSSLKMHPLAIPAVLILASRVTGLVVDAARRSPSLKQSC